MERELKEGDRIVDWDGLHGTARNVRPKDDDTVFDLYGDDGEVYERYFWVEGEEDGTFRFEQP